MAIFINTPLSYERCSNFLCFETSADSLSFLQQGGTLKQTGSIAQAMVIHLLKSGHFQC